MKGRFVELHLESWNAEEELIFPESFRCMQIFPCFFLSELYSELYILYDDVYSICCYWIYVTTHRRFEKIVWYLDFQNIVMIKNVLDNRRTFCFTIACSNLRGSKLFAEEETSQGRFPSFISRCYCPPSDC